MEGTLAPGEGRGGWRGPLLQVRGGRMEGALAPGEGRGGWRGPLLQVRGGEDGGDPCTR